jgi:hypothetical protein
MVTRGTALAAWRAHLEEAIGVAEAAALVDPFETVDFSSLATKQDLERFATKDDLARFATKDDLARFATKDELEGRLETVRASIDVLRSEFHAAEERGNARLNEAMRKQTWAIIVGMPTLLVALFTLARMLP